MLPSFHPIAHFRTITRHRHVVMRHCVRAGIPLQGLLHDLSKYSPAEFLPGALFYQGSRSPNEAEREQNGFSTAWMHHKGRNRHHFEYWTDYNPATRQMEPVPMPTRFVIEMFCDRVAASKVYRGADYRDSDPLAYYERAAKLRRIHPQTAKQLHFLLKLLAEQGEDAAFAYLRRMRRCIITRKKEHMIYAQLFHWRKRCGTARR